MEWASLLSPNRIGQKFDFGAGQARSLFEQDYDRIIFSHPFRKLQDKTQVHPLPEHDFVHTRLTHSLEVSSVGRSLGRKVGEAIIHRHNLQDLFNALDFGSVVAAASLAHDIGNPPYGHAGESAISDYFRFHVEGKKFESQVSRAEWEDLCRFEGNAQGFRILNKNRFGLKLTAATLGAFTKYPCAALLPNRDKTKRSQKKFGFFQSEQKSFELVAQELGLSKTSDLSWRRHPLAFLVEAADDICYSVIDLEDGCSLGLVSYEQARDLFEGVISASRSKLGKLQHLGTREEKIGFLRALAIGDLTQECAALFIDNEQQILSGAFDRALTDECGSSRALSDIIKVSVAQIYQSRQVVEIEAAGHEILPWLLHEFTTAGIAAASDKPTTRKYSNLQLLFPSDTLANIKANTGNTYLILREIIDFVSGLTDRHAKALYNRIRGV